MSHADEIAKQDSIRVKITWRVGDAKHEVEYDACAIEIKRNSTLNDYKTWTLTLLEVPRFFNVEEGTPSTPAFRSAHGARARSGPTRPSTPRRISTVNEELRGAAERAAPIFAALNHEPRNPR